MIEKTKYTQERKFLVSILSFNLISLVPWVGFYWHTADDLPLLDGPSTLVLLTITAIGTLIVLPMYCMAAIFISANRLRPHVRLLSAMLLFTVFVCCVSVSYFWVKAGWSGEGEVFSLAGVLYGAFSLTLARDFTALCRPNCT